MSADAGRQVGTARLQRMAVADDAPLEFCGTPGALHGHVLIGNAGAQTLPLTRMDSVDAVVLSDDGPPVRSARIGRAVRLQANETRTLPMTLAVDRHTAPGRYELELELAGQPRRVTLTVLDDPAVRIEPATFVLDDEASREQEKLLVVHNEGNLPVRIPAVLVVPLDDERLDCRSLRGALRTWAEREETSVESFAVEVGRQADRALQQAGALRVRVQDGPVEVAAGESRTIVLSVSVPATLDRRTRYSGTAAIYLTDLTFVVVPAAGGGPEEATPTPAAKAPARRRARSAKASTTTATSDPDTDPSS